MIEKPKSNNKVPPLFTESQFAEFRFAENLCTTWPKKFYIPLCRMNLSLFTENISLNTGSPKMRNKI